MSHSRGKVVKQWKLSAHSYWLLLALTTLLLQASQSQTSNSGPDDSGLEYADDDADDEYENENENENENEHADDRDKPVGTSRGWGGTNRTWDINEFPWIYVMFRDPNEQLNIPLDGYPAGFALELTHNIFLAHKYSIKRSSKDFRGDELMDMRRARDIKFLDPNKTNWTKMESGKNLGHWEKLYELWKYYGIYKLNQNYRLPPWSENDKTNSSRQWHPKPIKPRQGEYRYYPYWNKDKNLSTNCYLYTFSAIDWPEVSKFLVDKAMPPPTVDRSNWTYQADELRYFTRWPVKLVNGCTGNEGGCLFQFDKDRYMDEHIEAKYNAKRALSCGTWQDAGAPILCGKLDKDKHERHNETGHYFERRNLLLSYVVKPIDRKYPRENCTDTFQAWRLADKAQEVWEQVLYPYNCKYVEEYRAKNPSDAGQFPYDITDYHWPNFLQCNGKLPG